MPKFNENAYKKIERDLLKLLPPRPHKINLSEGPKFAQSIKQALSKYVTSVKNPLNFLSNQMLDVPFRQSFYADFLIQAKTIHQKEPIGSFLFNFKQEDNGSSIDTIFSPISLYKISGLDAEFAPSVHRISFVWYGTDNCIEDTVPNLAELLEEGRFHKFLTPVGPLVENINSTFITRIKSVAKGEVLNNKSPPENIKLVLPSDLFLDLDESITDTSAPRHLLSFYYACVTYPVLHNVPVMTLTFIKSNKSIRDIFCHLKVIYTDVIRTKYIDMQKDFYINKMTFGALCKVGSSSSETVPRRGNYHFRGSSLPIVEVPDFVADPGPWMTIL
ncbi:orf 62 [Ateline gammaherpesvirus 3]|uniref:Orf 62 n=1 Tax=Ateline herpesvirus 3 TaxID=85618 RepID=Q9YTK5_ATHV3|nr:orf 62 [Ateline gammaherpesvirus 3]AAC95586.1 orf 62 [Ateline gammaherpesvirus 3]